MAFLGIDDEVINKAGKGLAFGQNPMAAFAPPVQAAIPAALGMAPAAAPAALGAAAPAAAAAGGGVPAGIAAAGGPIGLAAAGIGAILGGAFEQAKKNKQADVNKLKLQAEGSKNLGVAQSSGLQNLMEAYRGIV